MLNRFIYNFLSFIIIWSVLVSCDKKTTNEYYEETRNNVIDGTSLMVSIGDKLPPIHSFAVPIIAGDTLIILDYRSTDRMCTAYDIYNDTTIGRFGKYGSGPGEIGNPLFRFYNKYNKNLYIGNAMRGKLSFFHLPEAVSDSTIDAIDGPTIDFYRGILSPYVLNDSTVLCTAYSDLRSRDSRLSKLNTHTGELTMIDTLTNGDKVMAGIAVSEKDNLIFSVDRQHDLIRILDLNGKVLRRVYGPEYDENAEEDDYFFSVSEICGNQVASTYTGRNLEKERSIIIFTDLEGRYLKTLHFDETIHGMQYHDKTRRLYLTTKGEPQIGYIELDKINH